MNILYINHYAGSPEMGMEFRPYYLAKEWIKMGNNVRIVAADFSHLRIRNPIVDTDFQEEVIDGITYNWVKTGSYKSNGTARAFTMFRFVHKIRKKAKWIAENWRPDVIITSSTYPLDTYAGQKIKRITKRIGIRKGKGAKLIHEVHDMWPASLIEIGGMKKTHPFVVLMQIAENSAYKHCDKCVSLLPYAKDYMTVHGLKPEIFINIQNGVVEEEWMNPEPLPEEHHIFLEKHKDNFIVGYFGGHALSNSLDNFLDVAKEYQNFDNDTIFILVGDGVEKNRLIKRAKFEEINNIYFLPPVPKKAVPNLIKYFDCSYMTGMPSPLYRFGLCLNKMYDSMMAGKPIICAFDAPKTLVGIYECGYECDPSNIETVVSAIQNLRKMELHERNNMGQNGRKAILNNFTYKRLAEEFIQSI